MALAQQTDIDDDVYAALVLENPDRRWELYGGRLWEKPGMTASHNRLPDRLAWYLNSSIFGGEFEVRTNAVRLRRPNGAVFIPDTAVIPTAWVDAIAARSDLLEIYDEPVPFVAEVWSPSTGAYDVDTKCAEYRARGDREIWRIPPYERTITAWRRPPDGTYQESRHTGGQLTLWALPDVTIDLDEIFAHL